MLEQIYIPKDNSEWKTFYNARPITKTSPIYKLLDIIMNNRLRKELWQDGKFILNNNQIGFRAKLGCELNILRLTEEIKARLKTRKKRKLWSLFIDLKSAFDTVDH